MLISFHDVEHIQMLLQHTFDDEERVQLVLCRFDAWMPCGYTGRMKAWV